MSSSSSRERWIPWLLFATAFIACAYFHQGGGWNQNVRFAMVSSMVEEGMFSLDSYLVYSRMRTGRLMRSAVRNHWHDLASRFGEKRKFRIGWEMDSGVLVRSL